MDCLLSGLKRFTKMCSAKAWIVTDCQLLYFAQIEAWGVAMLVFYGACSWFWSPGFPLLLAVVCADGPAGRSLQFFYRGSGCQLSACHCGGPGSIPSQSHLDFVVDKVALGWVSFLVLQLSPVSIIPPLLHTHSFIYHPCYIMFFSQYFSFPLSVSFHHCSILIHSSTLHTV